MKPQQRVERAVSGPERTAMDAGIGLAQLDEHGRHVFANSRYCEMLGLPAPDILGRLLGEVLGEAVSPLADAARAGSAVHVAEILLSPRNEHGICASAWINPIIRDGVARGSVCTFVDVNAYRGTGDPQNREITHRLRNVFAIAQAIVGQTLRGVAAPSDAVQVLNHRLAVISNVIAAMICNRHDSLALREIVNKAVATHRYDLPRIVADGPDLNVNSKAALAISLALHELSTNAVKYGALSNDEGHVAIAWSVEPSSGSDSTFRMTWREHSGPPVAPPGRKGFGSRLIVDNLGSDVGGRSTLTFPPEGARWVLECPLNTLTG